MNVSLTPELENLVNAKVNSGLYNSASEVIREALRLLKEQDALKTMRLEELRREVMIGVEQIRRGEYSVYNSGRELAEEIISQGEKELERKRQAR